MKGPVANIQRQALPHSFVHFTRSMRMEHEEFLALWRREMGKSDRDRQPACRIAIEFQAKLDDTIFRPLADKQLNRRLIAQAKYMLQEEYHAWRKAVPALHL